MNFMALRSRWVRLVAPVLCASVLVAASAPQRVRPGERAPDFTLLDTQGESHTLSEYIDGETIVVLEWFNPDCKFAIAHYDPDRRTMQTVYEKYADKNIVWLAINSGSEASGTADPALSEQRREEWGMEYPVLLDTDGVIGRIFKARTTPQMYVIDRDGVFAYIGAIDDQPYVLDSDKAAETNYVDDALDALLSGKEIEKTIVRPYGCRVKY